MISLQHNQIDSSLVTPLEYNTLQEYAKLLNLLRNLLVQIDKLKTLNSQQLLDNLRILETKLSLVCTLFKGSVYALFLQNEINMNGEELIKDQEMDDVDSSINSSY